MSKKIIENMANKKQVSDAQAEKVSGGEGSGSCQCKICKKNFDTPEQRLAHEVDCMIFHTQSVYQ